MLREQQTKSGAPMEQVAAEFVMAKRPSSIIQRALPLRRSQTLLFMSPLHFRRLRREPPFA